MKMIFNYYSSEKDIFFVRNMRNDKKKIIIEKSFDFALKIILITEELNEKRNSIFRTNYLNLGQVLVLILKKPRMPRVRKILFIK
jgi:hypothetical protein